MSLDEEIYELIAHEGNPPVDSAPEVRRALSAAIAKLTQENIPSSRAPSRHIESLNDEGLVQFEAPLLSTTQVEEVREFLLQEPVFNAHVPAQSDGKKRYLQPKNLLDRLRSNPRKYPFASYSLSSVVACPHLLEAALSDQAIQLAHNYLGCLPTLFSLHSWWTFGGIQSTTTHSWHRDPDDYKFCVLFIFLTDVDHTGGQHVFVRHSHTRETMEGRLKSYGGSSDFPWKDHTCHPKEHPFYAAHKLDCVGQAGTAFFADTYAIHKAIPPKNDRLVAWARYGLHAGRSYVADKTKPVSWNPVKGRIKRNEEIEHITRLILSPRI